MICEGLPKLRSNPPYGCKQRYSYFELSKLSLKLISNTKVLLLEMCRVNSFFSIFHAGTTTVKPGTVPDIELAETGYLDFHSWACMHCRKMNVTSTFLHYMQKSSMRHPLLYKFILKQFPSIVRDLRCMQIAFQIVCAALRETQVTPIEMEIICKGRRSFSIFPSPFYIQSRTEWMQKSVIFYSVLGTLDVVVRLVVPTLTPLLALPFASIGSFS